MSAPLTISIEKRLEGVRDRFHGKTNAFGKQLVPFLAENPIPDITSKSLSLFILFLNRIIE